VKTHRARVVDSLTTGRDTVRQMPGNPRANCSSTVSHHGFASNNPHFLGDGEKST
jgi:hypothetical protein